MAPFDSSVVKAWLSVASQRRVVLRAAKTSFIVGIALAVINHPEAIVHGDFAQGRVWKIFLTFLVPYMVSTSSSVSAIRGHLSRS